MSEGRISGERFNRLQEEILKRYREMRDTFKDELMVSGYPPFHDPLSPREQYDKLSAMALAGDPRFLSDPEAQAALQKLEMRFGPVAPALGEVL